MKNRFNFIFALAISSLLFAPLAQSEFHIAIMGGEFAESNDIYSFCSRKLSSVRIFFGAAIGTVPIITLGTDPGPVISGVVSGLAGGLALGFLPEICASYLERSRVYSRSRIVCHTKGFLGVSRAFVRSLFTERNWWNLPALTSPTPNEAQYRRGLVFLDGQPVTASVRASDRFQQNMFRAKDRFQQNREIHALFFNADLSFCTQPNELPRGNDRISHRRE